ncbi:MAG: hypothetical protein QW222_07650 [Candidatus Bathyarchaeia archaeon]
MKKFLYWIIPLSIGIALRLYPAFLGGLPFSTDAWPPIRNTELLLRHTPISLNDKVFDGYDNYWPANSLFGAVFSEVTDINPLQAMSVGIPLTAALAIPIFYVLTNKIISRHEVAFVASILLAAAYPHALFTAGVTKETYANPLYMAAILLFLSMGKGRNILLFTIISLTLVLTHHLTAAVTIAILAAMTFSDIINRVRNGFAIDKFAFMPLVVLATVAIAYNGLYAHQGLKLDLALSDWLSIFSHQIILFALTLYLSSKPYITSNIRTILSCATSTAVPLLVIFLCTKRPIVFNAPKLPTHYILYAAPFILTPLPMLLGTGKLRQIHGGKSNAPFFWFAAVIGLLSYAIFVSDMGIGLAYRTLNFLLPPMAIICAAGIYRIHTLNVKFHIRKAAKRAAIITLIAIVGLNIYDLYASVFLQERYMGYFWLYRPEEFEAAAWTAKAAINQTATGDMKISYLLKGYFNSDFNEAFGLKYLSGQHSDPPEIMLIYGQMQKNGYVLYEGCSIDLPENWTGKLRILNLIYSNSYTKIYNG